MSNTFHDFHEGKLHAFTIKSTTAAKLYFNDRYELHIHFFAGISGPSGIGSYFCLTFQIALLNDGLAKSEIARSVIWEQAADILNGACEQQSMLVNVRE